LRNKLIIPRWHSVALHDGEMCTRIDMQTPKQQATPNLTFDLKAYLLWNIPTSRHGQSHNTQTQLKAPIKPV